MKVGSLFSGIGGLDLGLERAGMTVVWQAENEPYASAVLRKHWPDVPNLGDVTEVDWDAVERVDLVCGGFPCQPVSYAGSRRAQDDERWLWPEFARCLRALRPRYVLLENVPGLLTAGFDDVLADLHTLGFDAEWSPIRAHEVGAPHLRERLFIIAHANRTGSWRLPQLHGYAQQARAEGQRRWGDPHRLVLAERLADETAAEVLGMADGLPNWSHRLRCLGNAVVPQVAKLIGRAILEADQQVAA